MPLGIPAGSDSAFHMFAVLEILETKNPLRGFSVYPSHLVSTEVYYPSFLHVGLAVIVSIVGVVETSSVNPTLVLEIGKSFIFASSLAGTAGFALLIKSILLSLVFDRTYS